LDLLERHGVTANLSVGDYRESLSNLREIW
jgi:hypothetical protein